MHYRYFFAALLTLIACTVGAQHKVGINTTTPIFQLDVRSATSSELTFLNVASQDNTYFTRLIAGHPGSPASSLSWAAGSELNFGTWDPIGSIYNLVMHLSPQNKVGINTFVPVFDLDVRGLDNAFDGGEMQLSTPDQTNFLRFFGGRLADPNPFLAFNDQDTFHLVTTAPDWSTYTRRLTMLPTGNVGIGTTLPLAKLDIHASGDGADLLRFSTERPWVFRQTGAGVNSQLTLQTTVDSKWFRILSQDSTNRTAVFHAHNTHSNVLLVPDGGEAGVGVEDPTGKFHIRHNSSIGWPNLRITEDDSDFARIKLETATEPGTYWDIAGRSDSVSADGSLNFFYGSPGSSGDRMSIKGNGNIGIGTTNPTEKLHVQGTFKVSDLSGTGDRNVIVDGNGKFKIGTVGVGDTDWIETATEVISQKNAKILTITGTPPFTTSNYLVMNSGAINKWTKIGVSSAYGSTLYLQDENAGDINMVNGGGNVGVGMAPTASKVTIEGPDNNGTVAALEIHSAGNSQVMLIDGNEIDAASNMHINANSGEPVSIGGLDIAAGYQLSVHGKVIAEEVRVQLQSNWPDYVFKEDYPLLSLDELESAIHEHQHLPGIPSASVVEQEGIALGQMQTRMMEKVEELTLYVLQLHGRISELEKHNAQLRSSLQSTQK